MDSYEVQIRDSFMTGSFPMEMKEWEGCLLATFSGTFNLDRAKLHAVELAREAKQRGMPRLLLDGRSIGGVMTFAEQHILIREAAEVLPRSCLLAVVRQPGTSMAEDSLNEITAWNCGLRLKIFTDLTEAGKWLRAQP